MISYTDSQKWEKIIQKYPYFQNIYILIAKKNYSTTAIAQAAIRVSDRIYLKKKLSSSKKNTQNTLITQFLNHTTLKPSQTSTVPTKPVEDLTQKNTLWNDQFATITMAEIMKKQGYKNEARKIYEKLLLKFPQKKTYFQQKIKQIEKN